MDAEDEIRHVSHGPSRGEPVFGAGTVRLVASTKKISAAEALARTKKVLVACLKLRGEAFNNVHGLYLALPQFFTDEFAPEPTGAETMQILKAWRAATDEQRRRIDERHRWSLLSWGHWMRPENRAWRWWNSEVLSENSVAIEIAVHGSPFPWQALRVLLFNCGFIEVKEE